MNQARLLQFQSAYFACLTGAILADPDAYGMMDGTVRSAEAYASSRSRIALDYIRQGRTEKLNISTPGWIATAKHLGVENTYVAWEAWFHGE